MSEQQSSQSYLRVRSFSFGSSRPRFPYDYDISNTEQGNGTDLSEETAQKIINFRNVKLIYDENDKELVKRLGQLRLLKKIDEEEELLPF